MFDSERPWFAEPWPRRWRIAATAVGPLAIVLGAMLVLAAERGTRNWFVWPLWAVWLGGILFFAVFWPWMWIERLTAKHEPRSSRRAVRFRLVALALIATTAAVALAWMCFLWLL